MRVSGRKQTARLPQEERRMDETMQLATYASALRYEDLPPEVVERAREIALHTWCVQLAGSTLPWSQAIWRHVRDQGGNPQCTIVALGSRTSAVNAALVNGSFGHSFEMDDSHAATGIKGGCAVVPAALAIAEQGPALGSALGPVSGRDFIVAIVAAYEVMTRIGLAVTPALMVKGHHPTGCCGPFGAAVAAGKLLGFDAVTMRHALSIAAAQSAGLLEAPAGGRGDLKRLFGGMAAANGLRAALLAREGLTGPATMLEGEHGFCHSYGDGTRLNALTAGLASVWQILHVHYKPYAQDGYIQPMTEAFDQILRRHSFMADDIAEVRVGCSAHAHDHIAGLIREPRDLTSAQFSINFSLALYFFKRGAGFQEYTQDSLDDAAIIALGRRIHSEIDDEVEAEWQRSKARGARVTVRLRSGAVHSAYVPMLRAMSPAEVDEKSRRLAAVVLDGAQCERLVDAVRHLDEMDDVAQIVPLLRATGTAASGRAT